MELNSRKQLRLKNYDYRATGSYFITICTEQKRCVLSQIVQMDQLSRAHVQLTELGYIVQAVLADLEGRYNVSVDSYVIMPNHVHFILIQNQQLSSKTVGQIVGALKSLVTKRWRDRCNACGIEMGKLWQRNYYEHIIRNDEDYREKAKYIDENPDKWCLDSEYAPHS